MSSPDLVTEPDPGPTSGHTHLVLGMGKSSERDILTISTVTIATVTIATVTIAAVTIAAETAAAVASPDFFSRSLTAKGNTSDRAPARLRIGSIDSCGDITIKIVITMEPEPVERFFLSKYPVYHRGGAEARTGIN